MEGSEQRRVAQKAVIAQLGLDALDGMAAPALMARAVEEVSRTLDVPYASVLQLLPGGHSFLVAAGVGWREGTVGRATVHAGGDSQAGYTMRSLEPVLVEDLATETRFEGSILLEEHGVVSGLSVIIHGLGGPFGVLAAHGTARRRFTPHDADFLQAVANVLGATIERQAAEEALRHSQQRMEVAVAASGGGIYEHSVPAHDESFHSARWAQILGYTLDELPQGAGFFDWLLRQVHPDDVARQEQAFDAFLQGQTSSYEMELRLRHKSRQWRWVRSYAQALERDEAGGVRRLAGMMFDIHRYREAQEERDRLLAALRAATESLEERVAQRTRQLELRTRQLRALASSLTVAEQRERDRIARILHDDLQQILYAAQMQTSLLQGAPGEGEYEADWAAQLDDLERLHARALAVTRSLAVELNPPLLHDEGLAEALAWLQNHVKSTYDLQVDLRVEDAAEPQSVDLRELLFQMVRELLFNVVKHAGVAQADVILREEDGRCVIEVCDAGRGFDVSALQGRGWGEVGYGLRSMRERLELFGGSLEMETGEGRGTRVRVVAPLDGEGEGDKD